MCALHSCWGPAQPHRLVGAACKCAVGVPKRDTLYAMEAPEEPVFLDFLPKTRAAELLFNQ